MIAQLGLANPMLSAMNSASIAATKLFSEKSMADELKAEIIAKDQDPARA